MKDYTIKGNLTKERILSFSDQDIRNMPLESLQKLARQASGQAKSKRSTAFRTMERKPDLPLPTAYKSWGKGIHKGDKRWLDHSGDENNKSWLNIDADVQSWVNYDFNYYNNIMNNRAALEQHTSMVIKYLSSKTGNVASQWEKSFKGFQDKVAKELHIDKNRISDEVYKEFWRIANHIADNKDTKNKFIYRDHSIRQELQDIIWGVMIEEGFNETYDKDLSTVQDEYAMRIIDKVKKVLGVQYTEEQIKEAQREDEIIGEEKRRMGLQKL